jgi:hypothetical protein
MKYKAMTAAALLLPMLTACGEKSKAEAVVRQSLRDPDSAKFGEFYYNRKTKKACLTTNAKNGLGGYTGDSQVRLEKTGDGWEYLADIEESHAECRVNYADETRSEREAMDDDVANVEG